jgi:hypothetical protein
MRCVLHFKIPNSCSHLCNKLRKLIIEVEVYKKLSRFSILLEDLWTRLQTRQIKRLISDAFRIFNRAWSNIKCALKLLLQQWQIKGYKPTKPRELIIDASRISKHTRPKNQTCSNKTVANNKLRKLVFDASHIYKHTWWKYQTCSNTIVANNKLRKLIIDASHIS